MLAWVRGLGKAQTALFALGVGCVLGLFVMFVKDCSCGSGVEPVELLADPTTEITGIEKKADAKKAEAKKKAAAEIKKLETEHADDIKRFSDDQEREYETVREKGPEAVAGWLTDFNRELQTDP